MLPILLTALFFSSPKSDSKIEFENAYVRIVRVHYQAHDKTRYHDHPATPTVYVYVTDGGRLKILHDEKEEPVIRPAVKAGGIRFNRGASEHHQVQELDGVASEYIRVELKIEPIDLPDQDVRRAPDDATPFENGMIRILRVTCPANSICPSPERPSVEIWGGKWRWSAPNQDGLTNLNNTPLQLVRVELKSAPLKKGKK
jgi:hypothetical protein